MDVQFEDKRKAIEMDSCWSRNCFAAIVYHRLKVCISHSAIHTKLIDLSSPIHQVAEQLAKRNKGMGDLTMNCANSANSVGLIWNY